MEILHDYKNISPFNELEQCDNSITPFQQKSSSEPIVTTSAVLPNGKTISLLKSVLSSSCENNCTYCPFRAARDFPRYTLTPERFSKLFMNLFSAGIVEGLFISSGIIYNGVSTQDNLIAVAEILRHRYHFQGYIHIKLMPGCEKSQVEQVMKLADRISINLEAPNAERLTMLAPNKHFYDHLYATLQWANELRTTRLKYNKIRPISFTTQFVVGASQESDLELLNTTQTLFKQLGISRVYYSPFHPYPNTPLENYPPAPLLRQTRLYQASFLIRDYGFSFDEIILDQYNNLPLNKDPKVLWAENHFSHNPVEVNTADPSVLIRIPGIGRKGVKTILIARKQKRITDISMLAKLGIDAHRATPYILINGKKPEQQLCLWKE